MTNPQHTFNAVYFTHTHTNTHTHTHTHTHTRAHACTDTHTHKIVLWCKLKHASIQIFCCVEVRKQECFISSLSISSLFSSELRFSRDDAGRNEAVSCWELRRIRSYSRFTAKHNHTWHTETNAYVHTLA